MTTEETALATYQATLDKLNQIAGDFTATSSQRTEATNAANKLSLDYAKSHVASIEARTQQFRKFTTYMEGVIQRLGTGAPLAVIQEIENGINVAKTEILSEEE
ncbi:hypothetical protein C6A37_05970 [Desulfobacteraceae bacterium SEEP-SAG9]|nr:hypothetical protein C6A37_05970 [Desulfobacteraceae bacterium SEEP-SAG9]